MSSPDSVKANAAYLTLIFQQWKSQLAADSFVTDVTVNHPANSEICSRL
jgi:hypothetical protein